MHTPAYSLRAIVAALGAFLVDIDTGLLGILRRLCTAPGTLIAKQLALREKVFREPLRLFVFANLVFFLIAPQVGLFRHSLSSYQKGPALQAELAQEQQAASGLSAEVYEERFDNHLDFRQPTFAVLLVFLLAAVARLVDPARPFGVQLMVSFYAVSWILLSWPILLLAVDTLCRMADVTDPASQGLAKLVLVAGGTWQWFTRVQRRGFGRGWAAGLAQGALLTVGWVLVMWVYEQLIFWLTWALLPVP